MSVRDVAQPVSKIGVARRIGWSMTSLVGVLGRLVEQLEPRRDARAQRHDQRLAIEVDIGGWVTCAKECLFGKVAKTAAGAGRTARRARRRCPIEPIGSSPRAASGANQTQVLPWV